VQQIEIKGVLRAAIVPPAPVIPKPPLEERIDRDFGVPESDYLG
jgi:hypothetical protein